MEKDYGKGLAFALAAAAISGVSVFLNGVAVTLADPTAYTALKNVFALIFIGSLAFALCEVGKFKSLTRRQWGMLALIGLIGGSVPFLMFFQGLKLGGAAVSSFIFRSLFIFAGVFGYLLLKERPEPRDIAAGIIILAGNALLLSGEPSIGAGQLLVLGATILWALEYTLSRKMLSDITPRVLMIGRLFLGSIFILAFMAYSGSIPALASVDATVASWLLVTSIMLAAFMSAWYGALRYLPVLKAASVLALGGIITASLNIVFLGRVMAPAEAMGLLLILSGSLAMAGLGRVLESLSGMKGVLSGLVR